MSDKWEAALHNWYNNSRTANLEYLDLADSETPNITHIFHNLAVVYDRLNLLARVNLKNYKNILEAIDGLSKGVEKLESGIKNLTQVFLEDRPLTKREVQQVFKEVVEQSRLAEDKVLRLTKELSQKLERVEALLAKVESWSTL